MQVCPALSRGASAARWHNPEVTAPVPHPITPEEYLVWEDQQELPWGSEGFQPVAINGGTWAHSGLTLNGQIAVGE